MGTEGGGGGLAVEGQVAGVQGEGARREENLGEGPHQWDQGLLLAAPCPRGCGEVTEAKPLAAYRPSGRTEEWTRVGHA